MNKRKAGTAPPYGGAWEGQQEKPNPQDGSNMPGKSKHVKLSSILNADIQKKTIIRKSFKIL